MQQKQQCFFYGGPQQQRAFPIKVPTFEALAKGRVLNEKRFFLNNSNSKWLLIGVVPATKILNDEASGFYLETFLCGNNCAPLTLGGIAGLYTLMDTVREIPAYSKMPSIRPNKEPGTHIVISTTNFAEEVSNF